MKNKSEILQEIDNKIEEIASLIDFIDKVDSNTFPNLNLFDKKQWLEKDKPLFNALASSIDTQKKFLSNKVMERAQEILDLIISRMRLLKSLISIDPLDSDQEAQIKLFSDYNYEFFMGYNENGIVFLYDIDTFLDEDDLSIIIDDIKSKYRFFDSEASYIDLYKKLPKNEKQYVSRKIIEFRNSFYTSPLPKTDDINNYIKELDFLLNKEEILSSAKNIIDASTIANNLKENITVVSNSDFANEYKKLAKKLDKEAASINYFIIFLFVIIILIVLFKLIFASIYKVTDFTLISATWLALVLSITALLGYLLKERKRLNNLRDYYRTIYIEMTALPKYMREFNSTQRVEMLVSLASNYFKGMSVHNKFDEKNEENNSKDNSVIVEKILDLSKNLTNQKN